MHTPRTLFDVLAIIVLSRFVNVNRSKVNIAQVYHYRCEMCHWHYELELFFQHTKNMTNKFNGTLGKLLYVMEFTCSYCKVKSVYTKSRDNWFKR